MAKLLDLYVLYRIIRKLSSPFKNWKAFQLGVIDEDGNILIPKDERTREQKDSLNLFDVFTLNVKKMLAKIPGGSSRLFTFASALYMLREASFDENNFVEKIQTYSDEIIKENYYNDLNKMLEEDAPANATGAAIAGINSNDSFAGAKVFEVDGDTLWKSRNGKPKFARWKKYVGEDEVGDEIRLYAKNNPKKEIILKNNRTGEMMFLRRKPVI